MTDYSNIPTIKDAKRKLGKCWFLLYDTCQCEPCRCEQKGKPFKELVWQSPSDTLQGKVIMKAPFTRKYIQASTHKAILEIGAAIEKDVFTKYEREKQIAVEEQKRTITEQFQGGILNKIKDAKHMQRAACHRELQRMAEDFEFHLADKVKEFEEKVQQDYMACSNNRNIKLQQRYEIKLKAAVESTTKEITKKLLEELARQEEILEMYFKAEIEKKQLTRQYERKKQSAEFKKTMQVAKQHLECKNIANMIYILCMERRKCLEEKEIIEEHYSKRLSQFNMKKEIQRKKISRLQEELEQEVMQVALRETCYLEIIRQYQKFINFALRACPTQAQFLLSIQKLMSFELSEILPKEKTPAPSREQHKCDTVLPWSPSREQHKCDTVLPWSHPEPVSKRRDIPGLILEDYHECFNELALPKKEEDIQLPSFYYRDKLFIREDFRNLISQGIVLTPSHDLWSEDLDLLVKTLREYVSEPDISKRFSEDVIPSHSIDVKGENEKEISPVKLQKHHEGPKKETDIGEINRKEKSSLKPKYLTEPPLIDIAQLGVIESSPCILAANSSRELLIKKVSLRPDNTEISGSIVIPEKKEEQEEEEEEEKSFDMQKIKESDTNFRPSVDLTLTESRFQDSQPKRTSFSLSPKDEEAKKDPADKLIKTPSKIAATRDSVAYLKESRQLLLKPLVCNVCEKRHAKLTTTTCTRPITNGYCCEKCLKQRALENEAVVKEKSTSMDSQKPLKQTHSVSYSQETLLGLIQPDPYEVKTCTEKLYPETWAKLYTPFKSKEKKISKGKCKKYFKALARIADDAKNEDWIPCDNDDTITRMRSFITAISDNPDLIKLFTACQR